MCNYEQHVQHAIVDCANFNIPGKQWAILQVTPQSKELGSRCWIEVGDILGGIPQHKILTIDYHRDGEMSRHAHV